MDKRKFRILNSEVLLNNFFHVEKWQLQHERFDGTFSEPLERFVLHRPEATAVVLHNPERACCYFVRQFRVGMCTREDIPWSLELPAGLVDEGESPEEAIIRETMEETGFSIHKPRHLQTVYPSPGIITERIHIYYAKVHDQDKVGEGGGSDQESEDLLLVRMHITTIRDMIVRGELQDAKTLLGLYSAGGLIGLDL